MTEKINDGGYVFAWATNGAAQKGLTRRDLIALTVLPAIMNTYPDYTPREKYKAAYIEADAMIAESRKP